MVTADSTSRFIAATTNKKSVTRPRVQRAAVLGLAAALMATTPLTPVLVSDAQAATLTWSKGFQLDNDWNAGSSINSNWTGNDRPSNGDSLVFGSTSNGGFSTNDLGGIDIRKITFTNSRTSTLIRGSRIDLFGDGSSNDIAIDNNSTSTMTISSALLLLDSIGIDTIGTVNLTGGMSGSNGIVKVGTGKLIMNGSNTFTGTAQVKAGTLQMGTGDALSDSTTVVLSTNTVLDFAGTAERFGGLSGTSGTVNLNGGGVMITGVNDASTIFSGVIEGNGSFEKRGTGTMLLGGPNTYSGGTTVTGGTLEGNATSLQGNIFNSANVTFNQTGSGFYTGKLSGSGTLTKTGSGTLYLNNADNSYSGDTNVQQGTLAFNGTSTSSDGSDVRISSNAGLFINGANTVRSLISANGTSGNGGTVRINGGTLTIGNGASQTFYGAITDGNPGQVGSLVKSGVGTQRLFGTNTYSGGTTVTGGTLEGNATSLQGNIFNSANVTFNQTGSGFYTGKLSGSGTLTKTGSGKLTLSGNNTYTGETNANQGTLALAGNQEFRSNTVNIAGGARLDLSGRSTLDGFSSNLMNGGRVDNNGNEKTLAGDLINQGIVNGGANGLVLAGDVTGGGNYEGDITFLKSFRPGNSPDLITGQNITFGGSNVLVMELGGLGRGTQYDAFDISGALTFGGTLDVNYLGGFGSGIALNDTFDLFNFDPFLSTGVFATINLPTLVAGWIWDISNLYNGGVIFVAAASTGNGVPGPAAIFILVIGLAGFGALRRRRAA